MAEEGMLTSQTPTQTFTFFKGAEEGKGNPNYLYEQRGRDDEATVEDLESYFNADKSNRLRESFGTFDNYLSYMNEREQLIQSGQYDVGNWAEADAGFTEDQQMIFEGDADLTIDPSDPSQNLTNLRRQQSGAQGAGYENWVNSDANQALLQKYGISDTVYSETGDKFRWNGSAYVKTQDEDKVSMGDYAKMAMGVAVGSFAGPALGQALTGAGGAATGATAAGATGATGATAAGAAGATGATAATTTATSSFLQGAINKTIGSAISQGIATGSVDAKQLATAGIMGGVSGVADAIKAGNLVGTAADSAINDLATSTGLTVAETTKIVKGVINGALSGGDVEDIALGAVQGFTTAKVQDLVEDTLGSFIEVPNLFDEESTTIPINDLEPFINTAVNAVFEGDLSETDVLSAVGDYLFKEGGTLEFLDPTKADLDLLGDTPEIIKQLEDAARYVGSAFDDEVIQRAREAGKFIDDEVYQRLRPGLRAFDKAVVQPVGQALSEAETAVRRALPDVSLPDGPDIDLPDGPDIDLPDGPDIDLPSIKLAGGGGGGMVPRQASIANLPVSLSQGEMLLYRPPATANDLLRDFTNNLVSQRGMLTS